MKDQVLVKKRAAALIRNTSDAALIEKKLKDRRKALWLRKHSK